MRVDLNIIDLKILSKLRIIDLSTILRCPIPQIYLLHIGVLSKLLVYIVTGVPGAEV